MKKKRIITLCASVTFYKDLANNEKDLKRLGFLVKIPSVARRMMRTKNFDVKKQKTWFQNPADLKIKTRLMKGHFAKVVQADAILVINLEKNGVKGYIGGNVLMEMVLAFHYKKPIYLFHDPSATLPILEEVYGMEPIILKGDLSRIK